MKFKAPNLKNLLNGITGKITLPCFNKGDGAESAPQANTGRGERTQSETVRGCSPFPQRTKNEPSCSGGDGNRDMGNAPYVLDIESTTGSNRDYRAALWTGKHLQLTVMSIPVGGDTGIEMHDNLDQFIRVESGSGKVEMGRIKDSMNYTAPLDSRHAILIPEGTYHNIINTGRTPLKLYSIYTPKAHPFGTVDKTKEDGDRREGH